QHHVDARLVDQARAGIVVGCQAGDELVLLFLLEKGGCSDLGAEIASRDAHKTSSAVPHRGYRLLPAFDPDAGASGSSRLDSTPAARVSISFSRRFFAAILNMSGR